MLWRMLIRRMTFAQRLTAIGWIVAAVGVLLLLVQLVMWLAHAAWVITLIGLLLVLIGGLAGAVARGRRREADEDIPYF